MSVHVFGIRHHGPGSARSLQKALVELQPDTILVEGPPDADDLIPLIAQGDLTPPVALLLYAEDDTSRAVFYPFAEFSPEWVGLRYAVETGIPTRFFDLPQRHRLVKESLFSEEGLAPRDNDEPTPEQQSLVITDPLTAVAHAAGYLDAEDLWEALVETQGGSTEIFAAVVEWMREFRSESSRHTPCAVAFCVSDLDLKREAWMRREIRKTIKDGYQKIAVVCGAFHVPALLDKSKSSDDDALLKALPKVKVRATWTPWTYGRLSRYSGYGAGIDSPAWYEILWNHPSHAAEQWSARCARLLRDHDLAAPPASVSETVRLAHALAAIRDREHPGLGEMMDAARSVLTNGNEAPMNLIRKKLVIGEIMGSVPANAASAPLQMDFRIELKRVKMTLSPEVVEKELDLRKPLDLDRSRLFFRLKLLGIGWGMRAPVAGGLGTFREKWSLQWLPDYEMDLIEGGIHGSTIVRAASACTLERARQCTSMAELSHLLQDAILAHLPETVKVLTHYISKLAAESSDVLHLMGALPALARTARYGDVRGADTQAVTKLLVELAPRIAIGLPLACAQANDDAVQTVYERIVGAQEAWMMMNRPDLVEKWTGALRSVLARDDVHGLIAGRCRRMLLDLNECQAEEIERALSLALSPASGHLYGASWIEGLLRHSGAALIYHEPLWHLVDNWVSGLPTERFEEALPLLRRTVATFPLGERRQIHGLVNSSRHATRAAASVDQSRAERILPTLTMLLGLAGCEKVAGTFHVPSPEGETSYGTRSVPAAVEDA